MSKHTPGPWGYRELSINEYPYAYYITCGHGALGYLPSKSKHDDEIMRYQEADARLIAAAPDLLEALKELLNAVGTATNDTDGMYLIDEELRSKVSAAIAKAELNK